MDAITIGTLFAAPGSRARGFLPVQTDPPIVLPISIINGAAPGPTLVVTAGLHGTEYPGIEAARRFSTDLDPARLSGRAVVVHIVNPRAFYRRAIYVSGFEEQNLNRMFPGSSDGTSTQRLAYTLFHEVIRKADLYVDLHGGDMIEALTPYVSYVNTPDLPEQVEKGKALAVAYGIKYICNGDTPGSAYVTAARAGIPTLLAEAGGQGVLSEPEVRMHLRGLNNVARQFGLLAGDPTPPPPYVWIRESVTMRSPTDGLYYPRAPLDQYVESGQELGTITDPFGEVKAVITAPAAGYIKYVGTSLAINTGDPLLSIAIPEAS